MARWLLLAALCWRVDALVVSPPVILGGDLPTPLRVLSFDDTRRTLRKWAQESASVKNMITRTRVDQRNVFFLAFCPKHASSIDYIFQIEIEIIEMTYSVLHIVNGAASPLSHDNVGSTEFRSVLERCVAVDEINYEELMRIDQFKLSWAYADMHKNDSGDNFLP